MANQSNVRITFGFIVLNGMPFIEYNLRAIYPYAHQIIVVEGAVTSSKKMATETGHSKDGTLEMLRKFKGVEDPDKKIIIVTAEDEGNSDGFWLEKDEMSQAYAKRASGNYLWQIDADEFYLERDIEKIIELLNKDPEIKAISFPMHTFWGSPNIIVKGFFLDNFIVHRIFAWDKGYKYLSHRPVTVIDNLSRDLRLFKWLTPKDMRNLGIYIYHYELFLPRQVLEKCAYYAGAEWTTALKKANEWAQNCYLKLGKPFRVHMMYNHISWLEKFTEVHPFQVQEMIRAINKGKYEGIVFRNMNDVDKLLAKPKYKVQSLILRTLIPISRAINNFKNKLRMTWLGCALIKMKNFMKGIFKGKMPGKL